MPLLFAAAALSAACSRAPEPETRAATPELPPPEASSGLVASPLDAPATGYTNERQAAYLREQARKMGVERLDKPQDGVSGDDEEAQEAPRPLSAEEVAARRREIREMARSFARARRRLEGTRARAVELPSQTPQILPKTPDESGPIEAPTPGAEGPEKK